MSYNVYTCIVVIAADARCRPVVIYNNFYTSNMLLASRKQTKKKVYIMPTLLYFFSFLLSFCKALTGRTALATPEITEERASESGYNSLLVPQRAQRRKERFEFNVIVNTVYTATRAHFITIELCIFFRLDFRFRAILPLKSLKFEKSHLVDLRRSRSATK